MPTQITSTGLSGNYKSMNAQHRKWGVGVLANGESFTRAVPPWFASASDLYTLGIIPTFALTAPSAAVGGSSTAGTYGIALVYRSSFVFDGLSGDGIQGNQSNIVDVTLAANDQATLTKVATSDAKVDKLDIYAAIKINGIYGTFYRVVKDATNAAGTVIFSVVSSSGYLIGAGVTGGTLDNTAVILADDNDYPTAQPLIKEVAGRLVTAGGIVVVTTGTFVNGNGTVTTSDTVYDGINFWFLKRVSDTSGGIDGKGTYLCRYATANTVTLVDEAGAAVTYSGTSGSGQTEIWQEPNRSYSKLYNPHAMPIANVNDDYKSGIKAMELIPDTNRLILCGLDWAVAEDYDRLPIVGINYISKTYGCSSPFSMVQAHGKLYWIDFGRDKREIIMCDGVNVVPISTQKIKTLLRQMTLDSNGDAWRVQFIHGIYYSQEDVIRWAFYKDNNTTANFVLELDIGASDPRTNAQFYIHRYQDVFTYGAIRGRVFVGQFGWTGGFARLGQDNVTNRYVDWAEGGTLQGDLASTGQTPTVLTINSGTLYNSGNYLYGVQVLVWREKDANGVLIINPTYYHCRISANDATTFTVNQVEVCSAVGTVSSVSTSLPVTPSGTGWKFAIGVLQGMIGPKWVAATDFDSAQRFKKLGVIMKGQDITTYPVRANCFENFDNQPRDSQYLDPEVDGQQVADALVSAHSSLVLNNNPVEVIGFSIVDNNSVLSANPFLSVESIFLDTQI